MSENSVNEISLQAAWDLLAARDDAILVDVRSRAEWDFVGVPALSELDKDVVTVEWATYPGMHPNASFVDQLNSHADDLDTPILFVCRSGARSMAAATAALESGFTQTYNVTAGFEGDLDADGHRHDGWKDHLPWKQS